MTLSEVKNSLQSLGKVVFKLENGTTIPHHFHVTEVGQITRHFIDCGGTVRIEKKVNFQLWNADDYHHRLEPTKLLHIIQRSEEQLGIEDSEIEVEYQDQTIGKYKLDFDGEYFILKNSLTACLAPDSCGIPSERERKQQSIEVDSNQACCSTNSSCC